MALLDLGGRRSNDLKNAAEAVVQAAGPTRSDVDAADAIAQSDSSVLSAAVDGLEAALLGPGPHVHRLENIIVELSRRPVARTESDLLHAYVRVLNAANGLAHAPAPTPLAEAQRVLSDALTTVERLFAPISERLESIDALVAVTDPTVADAAALASWAGDPRILSYFFSHVRGPGWFRVLADDALLRPPDSTFWPAFSYLSYLGQQEPDRVRAWLETRTSGRELCVQQAYWLTQLAIRLRTGASAALLNVTDGHLANQTILTLTTGYLTDAPAEEHTAQASIALLKRALQVVAEQDDAMGSRYTAAALLGVAISGASQEQPLRWLRILCAKTASILDRDEPLMLWSVRRVPDVARLVLDGAGSTLDHFVATIRDIARIADQAGVDHTERLAELSRLPAPLAGRVAAADLLAAASLDAASGVRLLEQEIPQSDPMPETLALLRALRDCDAAGLAAALTRALGPVPAPEDVAAVSEESDFPRAWVRAYGWSDGLPDELREQWSIAVARIRARWGEPSRDGLVIGAAVASFVTHQAPFQLDELSRLDPLQAAMLVGSWAPEPRTFDGPTVHGMSEVLKELVAAAPAEWTREDAPDIVRALRQPSYLAAYFEAIGNAVDSDLPLPVLAAIEAFFALQASQTGAPEGDHAGVWWPASTILALLTRFTLADPSVRGRVWDVLARAGRINDPPRISQDNDGEQDAYRPVHGIRTRVLSTALGIADKIMDAGDALPCELLDLLDEAIRLPRPTGLPARTALGSNLPWLVHHADAWTQSNWSTLVGADDDGLGAYTFRTYLDYGRPYKPLLEAHSHLFWDALTTARESAPLHVLHGLLWGVAGYEAQAVVSRLAAAGEQAVSEAARWLALSASRSPETDMSATLAFWEAAIEQHLGAQQYSGFGVFALADNVDDATWLQLTLRTATRCNGQLEFPDRIATRAAGIANREVGAMTLIALLLSSNIELWHVPEVARSGLEILDGPHPHDPEGEARLRERLLEREYFEARGTP
jgi:hypothetical protein